MDPGKSSRWTREAAGRHGDIPVPKKLFQWRIGGPAPTTTLNFATIVRTGNRMTADSSPLPGRPHSASIATAGMHWRRTESSAQRVRPAMPDEASPLPLDIEEELHLQFPPKSIRVVQGKVARRERAAFRSELLDQTLAE